MKKILIADDDELVRKMLTRTLTAAGFEIKQASNGREALDMVQAERFDLVLTDVIMPIKTGLGFLTDVQKSHPDLKVMVMTGGGQVEGEEYLEASKLGGAAAVIKKPIDDQELIKLIHKVIA